jgi:hypothetical protein
MNSEDLERNMKLWEGGGQQGGGQQGGGQQGGGQQGGQQGGGQQGGGQQGGGQQGGQQGGQPPENNGGSSSHETYDKKDDDNQTTTVRDIPPSPAALNGLTVAGLASAAAANDEVDIKIGDGGGFLEEDWKTAATAEEEVWAAANSRIFSHEVGGSQKRSLVPDLPATGGDGGRRNLGLSIFAGYVQAEEEAITSLRSAHNKVRYTSVEMMCV